MKIEYESDPTRSLEERPKASVVQWGSITPETRHESEIGCNFDHPVWTYKFPDSQWFDGVELVKLDPGVYTDFRSHRERVGAPIERVVRVFSGQGVLRTDRADVELERFDHVTIPTGAAYQFGNTGTDPLWFGSLFSVGERELSGEPTVEPDDSDEARAEYERIMAVRNERGLPIDPECDVDAVGVPDADRPEPTTSAFAEGRPKARYEAPEVGCNADWLAWMGQLDELRWMSDTSIMKLEPGGYTGLHTHFENEGPHEEIYWVMEGNARVETEYRDTRIEQFDCAFFPTGNAHGIGNVGTDTLWVAVWGARGGIEGEFDLADLEIPERPGQTEEFERVMAARKQRGLPIPPHIRIDGE